jgi:hypothetical protein
MKRIVKAATRAGTSAMLLTVSLGLLAMLSIILLTQPGYHGYDPDPEQK